MRISDFMLHWFHLLKAVEREMVFIALGLCFSSDQPASLGKCQEENCASWNWAISSSRFPIACCTHRAPSMCFLKRRHVHMSKQRCGEKGMAVSVEGEKGCKGLRVA